jgi:hypothetical protein
LIPAHGEVYLIQHYLNHRRPRTFKWLNSTKFFFGLPLNKVVKNIIKWAENQVLLFKDHEDSKLFQSIKIIASSFSMWFLSHVQPINYSLNSTHWHLWHLACDSLTNNRWRFTVRPFIIHTSSGFPPIKNKPVVFCHKK